MLAVRAIRAQDVDALLELAAQVGTGMTTLKPDRAMLSDRVAIACASFAGQIPNGQCDYVFVMEDLENGRLAGVCAIKAAVGLEEPFYNYRIGILVHSSRELKVFSQMETLYLSNDLTGSTELCSLFLHSDYRSGNNGKLLSKSRFMFIAQFPHLFGGRLIAEMRGYQSAEGVSPFYEGLGRHFFQMDFSHVDDLTSLGKKSFIAELMPRQPMYVAYLPPDAQAAIGKVHVNTAPARRLLEQEGMHCEGYIDIFDAGPVLQARISALRAVRESGVVRVDQVENTPGKVGGNAATAGALLLPSSASGRRVGDEGDCKSAVFSTRFKSISDNSKLGACRAPSPPAPLPPAGEGSKDPGTSLEHFLISNTTQQDFRVIVSQSPSRDGAIVLSTEEQAALSCAASGQVRVLALNPERSSDA